MLYVSKKQNACDFFQKKLSEEKRGRSFDYYECLSLSQNNGAEQANHRSKNTAPDHKPA